MHPYTVVERRWAPKSGLQPDGKGVPVVRTAFGISLMRCTGLLRLLERPILGYRGGFFQTGASGTWASVVIIWDSIGNGVIGSPNPYLVFQASYNSKG